MDGQGVGRDEDTERRHVKTLWHNARDGKSAVMGTAF